jgi:hypothetical protein
MEDLTMHQSVFIDSERQALYQAGDLAGTNSMAIFQGGKTIANL